MFRALQKLDMHERILVMLVAIVCTIAGAAAASALHNTRSRTVNMRPLDLDVELFRTARAESGGGISGAVPAAYKADKQTAVFRGGGGAGGANMTAIDTKTEAGALATREFDLGLRQNLVVSGRFSAAAATCGIRVVYVYAGVVVGISDEITLTASDWQDTNSRYVSPNRVFDGMGAALARVIVTTAPSSGNVQFWAGSY